MNTLSSSHKRRRSPETGSEAVSASAACPAQGLRFRHRVLWATAFALGVGIVGASLSGVVAAEPKGEPDYGSTVSRLEQIVHEELDRGILGGVCIALVDDQRVVCARGFGFADKRRKIPAASTSVYRAGSISKLFTAIAAMQLAERGKLDIDKPVRAYAPHFRIVVPFRQAEAITLRQLMCHRSGMIRESPVGSYFDPSEPGIGATVASLAGCVLVYPPNTRTKYSNVGPTITGRAIEQVAGVPFAEYQQKHVLQPLGMKNSSFLIDGRLRRRLATGYMRVADGKGGFREIEAPVFDLGTIPAGNLVTTVEDLARFVVFLLAEGSAGDTQVVRPETLKQMFTVQLQSEKTGYGLGFHVAEFQGYKKVSHMGAVYGHTTSVAALPQQKIGVVVLANEDIAMGPVRKLADAAMELMVEAKPGKKPKPDDEPISVKPDELAGFAGDYESESYWAELAVRDGRLCANLSGQRLTLTPTGKDRFLADGRFAHRARCSFRRDDSGKVTAFSALDQTFHRVEPAAVRDVPEQWKRFLGSYGPEFIPLIVSVKHGHLYAMTENMVDYRLTPMNRMVFKMPPGMYVDEQLVFQIGADGCVHGIVFANMTLPRRP